MNLSELLMFVLYLVFMLGIGIWFFVRSKDDGEKGYFLGGRQMGAWVSGLSAGASDMSAWVLMGMPASIYAYGMGKAWIPVGLFIGYSLSWIFIAPRLRSFSIVCGDSITIPQYLTNRFKASSRALQIISAVIFLVAYTVYSASSIKACGTLFETVLGVPAQIAMYAAAVIIVGYTFLGGFNAVCWTDFFQGLLMLGSLFAAPIVALCMMQKSGTTAGTLPAGYWNMMTSWQDILSGLGWGLGYAGMPHIIIRFMSVRSGKELKKAAKVGFDFEDYRQVAMKVEEELGEVMEAAEKGTSEAVFEEFGDLMFSAVNLSRFFDVNVENALTNATEKFINRFEYIERTAERRGVNLKDMTIQEMDELWSEIKHLKDRDV